MNGGGVDERYNLPSPVTKHLVFWENNARHLLNGQAAKWAMRYRSCIPSESVHFSAMLGAYYIA